MRDNSLPSEIEDLSAQRIYNTNCASRVFQDTKNTAGRNGISCSRCSTFVETLGSAWPKSGAPKSRLTAKVLPEDRLAVALIAVQRNLRRLLAPDYGAWQANRGRAQLSLQKVFPAGFGNPFST